MGDAAPGLLFLGLVLVALLGSVAIRLRARRRAMDDVAQALGGTRRGGVVTFVRDDREFRFETFAGSRYRPPSIELRTDSAPGTRWSIVPPAGVLGIGGGLGRGERVTTGDPEFDGAARLYSPTPLRAATFFAAPDRRKAVAALLGQNATALGQDDVEVSVRWSNRKPDRSVAAVLVPAAVELGRLAEGTPSSEAKARVRRLVVAQRAAFAAFVALALATGVLAGLARDDFQVLDWERLALDSLWYGVPLAVGLAVLAWRSGMMEVGPLRLRGLGGVVGVLVLVPYLVLELAVVANGWLDGGPPTAHDVRVLHVELTNGRHPDHVVGVVSWRGHGEERFIVTREFFQQVRPGRPVRVVTKPGRLGYEWIAHYALLDGGA